MRLILDWKGRILSPYNNWLDFAVCIWKVSWLKLLRIVIHHNRWSIRDRIVAIECMVHHSKANVWETSLFKSVRQMTPHPCLTNHLWIEVELLILSNVFQQVVFYGHTELSFVLNQLGFVWFLIERDKQSVFLHGKFVTVNFPDVLLLQLLETHGSKSSVLRCACFFVLALTRTQSESILSGGWPAYSHLIVSAQHRVRHF